jgi:hypothetical protein
MRIAIVLVAVAACGGGHTDIQPTLVLADRSDTELARLISAAGGTDMFGAEAQVDQFSDSTGACPAIAISGNSVTITGGCTTADMVQIDGSATLTNPATWAPEVPFAYNADQSFEFHAFALTQGTFTTTYDGAFKITDTFMTYDADITTTQLGVALRSDVYISCDSSGSCDISGSGLELVGVGGVTVDGSITMAGQATADFNIHGADTTLTANITQGCVSWQLDGTARQKVCP